MKHTTKKIKKGFTPMEAMIGIIITIISFYLILAFFVSNKDIVGTYAEDLQCRATIEAKSTATVDVGIELSKRAGIDSFLNVLNNKCPVDYLTIKSTKKDEIFKKIADEQAKCYYRYGEGEKDFLSSFQTSGNWCFVCGVVNVESNEEKYKYSDYVDWLSKNEYKKENGKSIKYIAENDRGYMEIKHTKVSQKELSDIGLSLQELLDENDDPAFLQVVGVVAGQYQNLQDLSLKKVDSSEPIYVVYRYNRIEKPVETQMKDARNGAIYGVIGAIFAGAVVEGAITGAASGTVCAVSIVGTIATPVCAVGGAIVGVVKGAVNAVTKTATSISKFIRLEKISAKISSLIQGSQRIEGTGEKISYLTFNGHKFLTLAKTKNFDIDVTQMRSLAKEFKIVRNGMTDAEKASNFKKADSLKTYADLMDDMKITKYSDIEKLQASKADDLKKLNKLFDNGVNNNMISEEILNAYVAKSQKISTEMKDYKDLKKMIDEDLIKNSGKLSAEGEATMKDVIRVSYIASAGMAGGYVGWNINKNSNQYVDIMTKEQYFRLCGTERRIDERMKAQK